MRCRATLWLLPSVTLATVTVHYPPSVAGAYSDTPASFSPPSVIFSADAALAATCPCDWLADAADAPSSAAHVSTPIEGLAGRALLVPNSVCTPGCSALHVACAAHLFNASIAIISDTFDYTAAYTVAALDADTLERWVSDERDEYTLQANRTGCADHLLLAVFLRNDTMRQLTEEVAYVNVSESGEANAEKILLPSLGLNLTVSTPAADDAAIDCAKYDSTPYVYAVTLPLWMVLAMAWSYNTYQKNIASAKDLHRLMCWVPLVECVHGLLSFFNYVSCPWDTTISLIYATFWAVVTILKEPVLLLCLLLVAKGWCITRNHLQRREVCVAGSILALLYASVSVQMSMTSKLATVPMAAMYVLMLCEIASSIYANLRILKSQILALRSLGVDPITTPAHTKYVMFVRLGVFTAAYATLELLIHTVFSSDGTKLWLFLSLHQAMELVIASSIGYTFRAQPFNILFQQVQQVAEELADQMLPSITTVELKEEMLSGANLIAWRQNLDLDTRTPAQRARDPLPPPTLIILNPGDTELPPQPRSSRRPPSGCLAPYPGGPAVAMDGSAVDQLPPPPPDGPAASAGVSAADASHGAAPMPPPEAPPPDAVCPPAAASHGAVLVAEDIEMADLRDAPQSRRAASATTAPSSAEEISPPLTEGDAAAEDAAQPARGAAQHL